MNSVNTKTRNVSIIGESQYIINREKHKKAVIKYNKTRIISEETRKKFSESAKKQMQGKTFYDSTGLVTVRLKGETNYIQINKEEYDKNIHETFSSGRITAKDWDGNTFQIEKNDERYLSGEIGGVTANRCIFISPDGLEYKTMNIHEMINKLKLAPAIKNHKNKGIIEYIPTPSNKSRYDKFTDINGWELKVLDKTKLFVLNCRNNPIIPIRGTNIFDNEDLYIKKYKSLNIIQRLYKRRYWNRKRKVMIIEDWIIKIGLNPYNKNCIFVKWGMIKCGFKEEDVKDIIFINNIFN
jgi:hypothetical protein